MKASIKPVTSPRLNLTRAMRNLDVGNTREFLKGWYKDTPWKLIPNVAKLNVELGIRSPIFDHFGIKKRTGTKIVIDKFRNDDINRYVTHQIERLRKARDGNNPVLYWFIANTLMKRSNSFRVLAINHVFNQWHRRYPLGFIVNVNRKVSKLINQKVTEIDYRRVYIPKGEKGWRPLGVPKPEWRVLLHMYSNFLTFYLSPTMSKSQHGFLPGKGTLTCWREILSKKVMDYPFVKEWDFKSFFDTVSLTKIERILKAKGIPHDTVALLIKMNESLITLSKEELSDESLAAHRMIKKEFRERKARWGSWLELQMFNDPWAERVEWTPGFRGVPQGSPTSPILANLIMDEWLRSDKFKKIAYADDSIGYSKTYQQEKLPKDLQVEINEEKSGWIRFEGKTIKPLKFLGLVWDGKNLKADTRKGSKLEITKEMKELMTLTHATSYKESMTYEEAMDYLTQTKPSLLVSGKVVSAVSWEKWFKNRLGGWLQSRLYSGEWKNPRISQCFEFTCLNKSWGDSKLAKHYDEMDIFNSSSFASRSLLNIFRYNQKLRIKRADDANLSIPKAPLIPNHILQRMWL